MRIPSTKFARFLTLALCGVLLLFMAMEVAHTHPAGAPDTTHCPLCVAAHVALHAEVALLTGLLLATIGKVMDRKAVAGFSVTRTARRIRPPPAQSRMPVVQRTAL